MSPTEFDLRQALSDGEGEGVDADLVIFAARERRAHRRQVLLSAAAAVVVVGGIAGGITALAANSSDNSSASASGGGATVRQPANGSSSAGADLARRGRTSSGTGLSNEPAAGFSCARRPLPTSLPVIKSPAGLSPAGELLAGPVRAYRVCVSPFRMAVATSTPQASKLQHITVTGPAADALTASIENASRTPVHVACPDIRTGESVAITLVPIAPSGQPRTPIYVSTPLPACDTPITNGKSVRFNWQIPRQLQRVLDITAVATGTGSGGGGVEPGPSGVASGSPPR